MAKQPTKAKRKPKNEKVYTKTIVFKYEPTFEERESIIRRCCYQEQDLYKSLRWIVVEKDMEKVKIKFFAK